MKILLRKENMAGALSLLYICNYLIIKFFLTNIQSINLNIYFFFPALKRYSFSCLERLS